MTGCRFSKFDSFFAGVALLGLSACGETPDKYRDIKHLEMPPTLAIEHHSNPGTVDTDEAVKHEKTLTEDTANAELQRLVFLSTDSGKPFLTLKTGFDRSWDLVERGLNKAEIDITDKNRDSGVYRVHFIADPEHKDTGLFSEIRNMINHVEEGEYTLTVDKDKKTTNVQAAQFNAKADSKDESADLLKTLRKSIILSLEK